MIILSFDFGTKNIGTAIGECITYTTRALKTISKNKKTYWKNIKKIIYEWKPKKIIVGLPLNIYGKKQKITRKTEKFAKKLLKKFKISVKLHDERYTTIEAKSILFKNGGVKQLTKKNINSISAEIILKSWFYEKLNNKKKNKKN
ncbi:MAG: Holliday junction resolvase RuvX [Buchnera aphidicola (Periphyllus acericola)]|uniref:Holliday junction resolvase RuvX n=1 Tax=Buchnera aphidicola TaxID=9 RepID=UPI0030CEB8BD|nr:Holliday junction resolvase RuvX [Buchnera aphidicola (Periphyllus acericola)]